MKKLFGLAVVLSFIVVQHAKADPPTTKYIRLSLAVMEYGDCYVKVEETSEPMSSATKFQGDVSTLDRFPNAEIMKSKEGVYRLIHTFDHPDPLEKIFVMMNKNIDLNNKSGTLEFKTSKDAHGNAYYWSKYQLPLIISYDRLPIAKQSGIITLVGFPHLGRFGVNLMKRGDEKAKVLLYWNDDDENGILQKGKDGTYLTPMTSTPADIDPATGYQNKFRLPLPNAHIEDVAELKFDAWADVPQSAEIAHLLVQGRPVPVIGLGAKDKPPVVFVSGTIDGGIADKAGIKIGDILVSINGQPPKSALDVADTLSKVSIGDKMTFKIKRMDQEQEIKFTVE